MKIVAVINQKGGVGKTTTTVNTGAALARCGHRVLLVDLDPQANLTIHLDRRPDLASPTMTHVLLEERSFDEVIVDSSSERLVVAPADTSLGGIEQVLANRIGRETILRDAFESMVQAHREAGPGAELPDYVLLDCPPSLGVLSANALVAADEVIVPIQAEYFSLQGMAKLTEVVDLVRRRLNPRLSIRSILPCMVDLRTRLRGEVLGEVGRHFGNKLSPVSIRNNVKLAEAPSFGQTIFEHAPDSNGAADYAAFAASYLSESGTDTRAGPEAAAGEATGS